MAAESPAPKTERAAPRPMAIDPASPWRTAKEAGAYLKRSPRFVVREINAGRLRGCRIGGRREIFTCDRWCDQWVEDQATPIMVGARRRA